MGSRSKANIVGWLASLVALAACVGAATAAALLTAPPEDLKTAPPTSDVAVGIDTYDDSRSVQLTVTAEAPGRLFAPTSGKITVFACLHGAAVESGATPLSIDGTPLLALATRVPLWRDLTLHARGDDVRAVQDELIRLGHPLTSDAQFGRDTLAALKDAFKKIGVPIEGDTVPRASIVWIPEVSTTVSTCDATVGADVASGESLATFSSVSPKVTVVAMPQDLVPGARVVEIGVSRFPLQENGDVKAPDLASIGIVAPSDASNSLVEPIEAQLRLAEPVDVSVVPPNAVYNVAGREGCVLSGQQTYRVHLLGSQLGQSLVTFTGPRTPRRVDVPPRTHAPCV